MSNAITNATEIKVGFIGAGTVGTALAVRLKERNYPVIAVASRSKSSADKLAESVPGCNSSESKQAGADLSSTPIMSWPGGS